MDATGDGLKGQLNDTDKQNSNINNESVSESIVIVSQEDLEGENPNIPMDEGILEVTGSNHEDQEKQSSDEEDLDGKYGDLEAGSSGNESDIEDNDDMPSNVTRPRLPHPDLPPTVTLLSTDAGSKVYLVGTTHFSEKSQNDVTKTIESTQPDVVLIQLCSSRIYTLHLDDKKLLEDATNIDFGKIKYLIKQIGFLHGLLHLIFLRMSARLTKQLGMAPGGEFRRALRDAKRIECCRLQLGDRPIYITLARALSLLSMWQKLKLAWTLIRFKDPVRKVAVEMCQQRDLLEEMLQEMIGVCPGLSRVFVDEQDAFLAHTLRHAAQPIPHPNIPDAFIPSVVVGIVGMVHVEGIRSNWNKSKYKIKDIMQEPQEGFLSKAVQLTFHISLMGIVTLACYHVYKWTAPLLT